MREEKDIFKILSQQLSRLKDEYDIEKIGVFGSVARGEQTHDSDVDILVEFSQAVGMVKFLQLENNLKKLFGVKVDLVTKAALKKHIGQQIMREVKYVN